MDKELSEFLRSLEAYSQKIMPSWMTQNSSFVSISQANALMSNLQISLDFRVSNRDLLNLELSPESLDVVQRLGLVKDE